VQVTGWFARHCGKYVGAFRSCNEAEDGWCAACDKCVFVFTLVSAFLEPAEACRALGGANLFEKPALLDRWGMADKAAAMKGRGVIPPARV
jgi:hypothetical protein